MSAVEHLEDRIERLQRELTELQREIRAQRPELPAEPFDALVVRIMGERYLVPVAPIREVVPIVWPTPLADGPAWVLGTFRFGPEIVPMIDVAARLLRRTTPLDAALSLVVVDHPRWLGLLIESAAEVVRVDPARIAPPTPGISQAAFVLGTLVGERGESAGLLSIELLGREVVSDDAG